MATVPLFGPARLVEGTIDVMSDRYHVYPASQEQMHDLESASCWCGPMLLEGGAVVVHQGGNA